MISSQWYSNPSDDFFIYIYTHISSKKYASAAGSQVIIIIIIILLLHMLCSLEHFVGLMQIRASIWGVVLIWVSRETILWIVGFSLAGPNRHCNNTTTLLVSYLALASSSTGFCCWNFKFPSFKQPRFHLEICVMRQCSNPFVFGKPPISILDFEPVHLRILFIFSVADQCNPPALVQEPPPVISLL